MAVPSLVIFTTIGSDAVFAVLFCVPPDIAVAAITAAGGGGGGSVVSPPEGQAASVRKESGRRERAASVGMIRLGRREPKARGMHASIPLAIPPTVGLLRPSLPAANCSKGCSTMLTFSARDRAMLHQALQVIGSPLQYPSVAEWRAEVLRALMPIFGADAGGFVLPFEGETSVTLLGRQPELVRYYIAHQSRASPIDAWCGDEFD